MGKRSLDDARTFGRSIQPTHDLQPEAGSANGDSVFAILDVNEIEADAQPKKITFTGVANVVGPLLTPTAIPAAGSDTQVQFNDGGFFGADGGLTYNKTTDALSAGAFVPTGSTVPTNGVYLPSANTVALSTNGTGRLFVDASGRVGLGSSPTVGEAVTVGGSLLVKQAADTNGYVTIQGSNTYVSTATNLILGTNGSERLRVTSAGLVGIGTASPAYTIDAISTSAQLHAGPSAGHGLIVSCTDTTFGRSAVVDNAGFAAGINLYINNNGEYAGLHIGTTGLHTLRSTRSATPFDFRSAGDITLSSANVERARIDSSGRLLVGTSSARTLFTNYTPSLQVEASTAGASSASLVNTELAASAPVLFLAHSRGANGLLNSGDGLGTISFNGGDGTDLQSIGAQIVALVDGTPGANDMPGRLVFSTTADGASTPTERMRIKANGTINYSNVAVYADNTAALAGGLVAGDVYRKSDGTLMITY